MAFLLGDRSALPVDVYYALYFASVAVFLFAYARATDLDARTLISRRRGIAAVLAALGGLALVRGVLARPATPPLEGLELAWALVWRGLVYGAVDGLLLLAFPWAVSWRAFGAERRPWPVRTAATAVALAGTVFVTTAYHLGYRDFRSRRVLQPNIGAVIGSMPTLLSANPLASVVSHTALHVTAVLHSPGTDLFLPPHRPADATATPEGREDPAERAREGRD